MYQARKYLDKNSLFTLYNNCIYPYLIYCVESPGAIYQSATSAHCLFYKRKYFE